MQQPVCDPYEVAPAYETPSFLLRLVQPGDAEDLLACYADPQSAQYFNSDNCTSNFVFLTVDEMSRCISFWLREYAACVYIRFSILSNVFQVDAILTKAVPCDAQRLSALSKCGFSFVPDKSVLPFSDYYICCANP